MLLFVCVCVGGWVWKSLGCVECGVGDAGICLSCLVPDAGAALLLLGCCCSAAGCPRIKLSLGRTDHRPTVTQLLKQRCLSL